MDQAKNYILNCIQALLGLEKQPERLASSQVLDNLLYRPEKKSLTLQYQPGKGLKVYNPNAPGSSNPIISRCDDRRHSHFGHLEDRHRCDPGRGLL
jgi:dynein heavy chain 2